MSTKPQIEHIRHSLAHLLAASVLAHYPGTKLGIGPTIEDGFYYDFDLPQTIGLEALPKIEKTMRKLIQKNQAFTGSEKTINEAKQLFQDQPFKLDLIRDLEEKGTTDYGEIKSGVQKKGKDKVTVYQTGTFVDLCAGGHVENTGQIDLNSFKLTRVAGAYWRGSEKNKMLTRIYGVAFHSKAELAIYLKRIAEAENRDQRKLGRELDLFIINDEVGQGLPLWQPKGALLRHLIMNFAFETYLKNGYEPISTPHIASLKLWKHSGHLEFYKDSLYGSFGIEGQQYMLKPMNCPLHVQIYKNKRWSYRDLPVRWTEMGTVYRYEKSGVLHGLTRVRGFTQDDAHIICTPEQLHSELKQALKLCLHILNVFGFKKFTMNMSVRDPKNKSKYIGNDEQWKKAEEELMSVLKDIGYKDYVYDVGGAVFYGPKIDIMINDALNRPWQISTIQFDFNLPSRFEMNYQGPDGQKHTPYMIHRALLGSLERFIGILIEHYAGAFPVWLSPVQVKLINVGKAHRKYAEKLGKQMRELGIRAEMDLVNETVPYRVRKAEQQKVPYILVIGDKEVKGKQLAVRMRGSKDTKKMTVKRFMEKVKGEIEHKK